MHFLHKKRLCLLHDLLPYVLIKQPLFHIKGHLMNNTKIILSILCLLTISQINSSQPPLNQKSLWEKVICAIGKSYPMSWIEKKVGEKFYEKAIEQSGLDNGPATPHYQALGKEAQSAVGIPEEYQVPIKRISPNNPLAQIVAGIAFPHAIYVNEEKLNEQTYGVQCCALYHEAVHKKYNDSTADNILECTFFGTTYGAHKILRKLTPKLPTIIRMLSAGGSGILATYMICTKYHHYMERRADIEGCYATQCATSVEEAAVHRRKIFEEENHSFKNNGYLQADEMEMIAQDLQKKNMICTHHENNN